jgi:hypothetical protein
MSVYDFTPPTDEEIAMLIRPEPGPGAPPEDEEFKTSFLQRFMENLAMNRQPTTQEPRSFGQGFAGGIVSGLSAGGARVASARDRFEKRQERRRLLYDEERRKATEKRGDEKRDVIRDAYKTYQQDRAKKAEHERDNPVVTQAEVDANPRLAPRLGKPFPMTEGRLAVRESQSLVPVVKPDGSVVYTRTSEAVGAQAPRPAPSTVKMPSATERAALTADTNAIAQVSNINKLFRREFVGPLAGPRGRIAMRSGVGLRPGEAEFRGGLAIFRNAVINALSGAAVSESEAARMRQQIPQEDDPPEVFRAKLDQTKNNLLTVAKLRRETFIQTGLDLSDMPPLDSGAPEIEWKRDASGKPVPLGGRP